MFKSKIDCLEQKQKKLEKKIANKISKVAFKNAKIEAKVTRLQEIAFANRTALENAKIEIGRQLERNADLIIAEAKYCADLGKKYNKGK